MSLAKLYHQDLKFTFNDVLLVPQYSKIIPSDVDTSVKLSDKITLGCPLISAAMDTVTEAPLAIELARLGGIGIIHKNFTIQDHAAEVTKVKRSESMVVMNPYTINVKSNIGEVITFMTEKNISGLPVVDDDNVVVGIVTKRDIRFISPDSYGTGVDGFMTHKVVTASMECSKNHIQSLFRQNKIEKVVIVDKNNKCIGLSTVKDLQRIRHGDSKYSHDSSGRLVVGAAIGTGEKEMERMHALVDADVDVLTIDTAHGDSKGVVDMVRAVKKIKDICIIAGNVVTKEGVQNLYDAGANLVKIGVGPGSICTTRTVAGVGFPQLSAIIECSEEAKRLGINCIGDGGIQNSGDIAKAIAGGAIAVMMGSLLAGTEESPGEIVMQDGIPYKKYRGMGSTGAMLRGSADRYFQGSTARKDLVSQGVEGKIPFKGSVKNVISQLVGGLRASMGYTGSSNIELFQQNSKFIKVTPTVLSENKTSIPFVDSE